MCPWLKPPPPKQKLRKRNNLPNAPMLTLLAVRNVVLIKALDVEFHPGLTVLTGETGAGKSILLDAMGLALGSRANFALIGPAADRAEVTAVFSPPDDHPAWALLEEAGIDKASEIIMRRRLRDGKSSGMINDTPIGQNTMRMVGDTLVEIQGQFEGRGLLDVSNHRNLLDRFAEHQNLLDDTATAWDAWQEAKSAWQLADYAQKKAREDEDWLRDAVQQLDELAPEAGEEANLSREREVLANTTRIAEATQQVDTLINGETGAVNQIAQAARAIERLEEIAGSMLRDLTATIARSEAELDEASRACAAVQSELEADPDRLTTIDDRLHELRQQARKHNVTPDELPAMHEGLRNQLASIEDSDGNLLALKEAMEEKHKLYVAAADTLTHSRQEAAKRLDASVMAELPPLKLEQARFQTLIAPLEESDWGKHGNTSTRFESATNPGMEMAPIDKIASGGELARFLLALKVVLADTAAMKCIIFDEVDTGVGGAVASAVGSRLARLGKDMQTLVITHSPQVAALGHQHYQIRKSLAEDAAVSTTEQLTRDERIDELSRMLAGEKVTDESRAAAVKLLDS
ncbi:MAG: DNA repair protein RecN [Proteobacteria bacterium]|nr:DNA repair protein RecN [Pseudomonadota bacterium]